MVAALWEAVKAWVRGAHAHVARHLVVSEIRGP